MEKRVSQYVTFSHIPQASAPPEQVGPRRIGTPLSIRSVPHAPNHDGRLERKPGTTCLAPGSSWPKLYRGQAAQIFRNMSERTSSHSSGWRTRGSACHSRLMIPIVTACPIFLTQVATHPNRCRRAISESWRNVASQEGEGLDLPMSWENSTKHFCREYAEKTVLSLPPSRCVNSYNDIAQACGITRSKLIWTGAWASCFIAPNPPAHSTPMVSALTRAIRRLDMAAPNLPQALWIRTRS